jgi:EmrB/QacA subfamily drug resistance transporter
MSAAAPLDPDRFAVAAPDDPVVDATRRRWILISMCTALVAVVASVSGLNVAQQDLAVDLGASQSQLLWVINGYTVALAALLLPIGAIGDRFGRKRVLLSGLVVFVAANLAAAVADTVTQLLAARVVAGVGAAMIMPVTLSVITSTFPAEDRDRAVGVWAGFAGAGGILGLVVSSVVIDYATWPWVFALPVVLSLTSLVISVRVVPHSREHHEGRFDVVGSVLSAVGVGALVLGIHEGPEVGWSEPITLAGLGIGVVALLAFVVWELRQDHPLLQLRVFSNRTLTSGSVNLLAVFAIMMGIFLVLVQFFQAALGYSAIRASMALMPMALLMLPLSNAAPLITRRIGVRSILTMGTGLVAVGLAMLAAMADIDGGYWSVLPGLLVIGTGVGLSMTPSTSAITESLPPEEQGVASALNDTVRELGGALGIALIGSILSAGYRASVGEVSSQLPPEVASVVDEGIGGAVAVAAQAGPAAEPLLLAAREAFVDGWVRSMWVAAGVAALTAAFVAVWTPRHVRDTAAPDRDGLDTAPAGGDAAREPAAR